MFKNQAEERTYIKDNFIDITSSHVNDDHWDLLCDKCNLVRGFQVIRRGYTSTGTNYYDAHDLLGARSVFLKCPVCATYKILVVFQLPGSRNTKKWYQALELPTTGIGGTDDLPSEPKALRIAYRQAVKSMGAGAYIAAAVMYRRALQIITRDIGKATRGNLGTELASLVGKKVNGVTFTQDFSNVGYIIKEAGNQGAHPDEDPDLLDFTQQDAKDLHQIFTSMVAEIFIAPKAADDAKQRFIQSRKIT